MAIERYTIVSDYDYWSEVGEQVYIYLSNQWEYRTYSNPVDNQRFVQVTSDQRTRRRLEAAVGSIPTVQVWDGHVYFGIIPYEHDEDEKVFSSDKDRNDALFVIFVPLAVMLVITLFACYWSFWRAG